MQKNSPEVYQYGRGFMNNTSDPDSLVVNNSLINLIPKKVITFLDIHITLWALKDGSASLIYVFVFENEIADCAVSLWKSATNFLTPPLFDVAVFALPAVFIFATSCKLNDLVNTNRIRSLAWTGISLLRRPLGL